MPSASHPRGRSKLTVRPCTRCPSGLEFVGHRKDGSLVIACSCQAEDRGSVLEAPQLQGWLQMTKGGD